MESWNQHFRSTEVESYSERPLMCKFCKKTQTTRARCRIKPWEARGRSCTFYKIWILDHGRSQNSERGTRVDMRTRKRSYRSRGFHELDFRFIRWRRKKHRRQCRVYKEFFLRHRSMKEFTQKIPKSLWELAKIYNEIITEAPLIAQPSAEWKNEQLSHSCKADCQKNWWDCALDCCCLLAQRARQHSTRCVARSLTDHQFFLGHWLSTSQLPKKRSQEYVSLERKSWKEYSWTVCCVREEVGQETWWRQSVTICKHQKPRKLTSQDSNEKMCSWKGEHEFPCANGTLRRPDRPRLSLTAWGNLELEDDVEIEESDKKGRKTEDSWSRSG